MLKQTIMKVNTLMTTLMVAAFFLLSFTRAEEDPIDRLGIKGPIEFNKTNFKLSWTAKPNDNNYVQEYLPNAEQPDKFNHMLTVHLFLTENETKDVVQKKIEWLENRKTTDKLCNYVVNESPDGKEFMIDFLVGDSKGDKMTVAEFNIYRYSQVDLGNNKKGILIFFYSERSYGDEIPTFLNGLGQERTKYLNEMISTEMSPIKIVKD